MPRPGAYGHPTFAHFMPGASRQSRTAGGVLMKRVWMYEGLIKTTGGPLVSELTGGEILRGPTLHLGFTPCFGGVLGQTSF